jgi:hypothetical protein
MEHGEDRVDPADVRATPPPPPALPAVADPKQIDLALRRLLDVEGRAPAPDAAVARFNSAF